MIGSSKNQDFYIVSIQTWHYAETLYIYFFCLLQVPLIFSFFFSCFSVFLLHNRRRQTTHNVEVGGGGGGVGWVGGGEQEFCFGIDPPRPDEDITRSSQYSAQCLLTFAFPSYATAAEPPHRRRQRPLHHLRMLQLPSRLTRCLRGSRSRKTNRMHKYMIQVK